MNLSVWNKFRQSMVLTQFWNQHSLYLLHLNPSAYPEPDLADAMPLGPKLIQL